MNRQDYVLGVLAASDGEPLTPVQVQKLFFLLDRKASRLLGGPHFAFEAYDYGPFDKTVYYDLRDLARGGDVVIEEAAASFRQRFAPSPRGLERGRGILAALPPATRKYVRDLAGWVRAQGFASLVAAVYNEYPEMKANSIFKG